MAITKIFDISARSLGVYRRALEVTSHNIVNSTNPDYSRQRVNFETDTSDLQAGLVWGNGVRIADVRRLNDSLVGAHIITENSKYNNSYRQNQLITDIEKIFSEPSDLGLSNLFTSFFSSFDELASSPSSMPLRTSVVNAAQNLASKVNSVNQSLSELKVNIRNEYSQNVTTINSLLDQIHQINQEQFVNSYRGVSVNDLIDKRDKLIGELSKLVNINVTYDNTNSACISIGGALAVDRLHSSEFQMVEDNGKLGLKLKDGQYSVNLSGGQLNALEQVYSQKIPAYKSKLDEIVNKFVNAVNQAHSAGYTLSDPPETGISFFESYEDGVLKINPDIINDPGKIAASIDGTSGNGDIALRIAQLTDSNLLNGATLQEAYASLINTIGNDGLLQENYASANEMVLTQLKQQRDSISGVSVDEEMTNIIKFQRSYDASAKLITIADEMLKTIINMV